MNTSSNVLIDYAENFIKNNIKDKINKKPLNSTYCSCNEYNKIINNVLDNKKSDIDVKIIFDFEKDKINKNLFNIHNSYAMNTFQKLLDYMNNKIENIININNICNELNYELKNNKNILDTIKKYFLLTMIKKQIKNNYLISSEDDK